MSNVQRVVVVDGLVDIPEVLHAVLAPKGMQVDWVRSHVQVHSDEDNRPSVIVMDASTSKLPGSVRWNGVPHVILTDEQADQDSDERCKFLQKPFRYTELISTIERLLGEANAA